MENKDEIFKKKHKEKKPLFNRHHKVAEANAFDQNEKKHFSHYLQLPKRWVDVTDPFYFKVYNWKTDGLIFLATALFVPFFILVILTAIVGSRPTNTTNLISQLGYMVPAVIGFVIFSLRDKRLSYSSGVAFYFLPVFSNFGIGLISSYVLVNIEGTVSFYIQSILDMAIYIIWLVLIFRTVPSIGIRIKKTFKANWLMLLIVSLISAVIMWAVSNPLLQVILQGTPLGGTSGNQERLEVNSTEIFVAILLFIKVIIFAPLYEEIVYRHIVYTGSGNRIIGFFASAFIFGMIHIIVGPDLFHILPYLVGGFCLSGVFTISRGNVTYSWMTHLFYNLISFILMYAL